MLISYGSGYYYGGTRIYIVYIASVLLYVTRYEKTCQKSLFIEIALLVSTERSRSALFNGAKRGLYDIPFRSYGRL